jgi:hypothetical protein
MSVSEVMAVFTEKDEQDHPRGDEGSRSDKDGADNLSARPVASRGGR